MQETTKDFSIIICLFKISDRFYFDLDKFCRLSFKPYEIILVTEKDAKIEIANKQLPIKIVKSNKEKISLGEKRDIGIKVAKGKICAFIDDDAYPDQDWLKNALRIFKINKKIGVVGGPNVTPPDDFFWEQVGGHIYESYLTSGELQYRFLPRKRRLVGELPGVNLIIRKDILEEIGGFNSRLYSGDDSKVCSAITARGYKIIYDPKVVVYHHRRAFPKDHLRQVRNMGRHRGFFVKAYPATLAPLYFVPMVLAVGFIGGAILSVFLHTIRILYSFFFLCFFLIGYISSIKNAGFFKSIFVSIGIISTHIVYGTSFIEGMTLKHIERKT